jgi:lysozyme family protein
MATVPFTENLRRQYQDLFNSAIIRADRVVGVNQLIASLLKNQARYENVARTVGMPWFVIAVLHTMEASQNFTKHLHNGDPLTKRTVQVPAGRPKLGNPPFTWEQSASDALALKGFSAQTDWSLAGTLYQIERYNGWGYRLHHPHVLSPYLWSFSNHYTSGKYVADGTWSDTAKSSQCGAAVLLRRMAENGQIQFLDQPAPTPRKGPLVVGFTANKSTDTAIVAQVIGLQQWLNTFPGVFVKLDGVPGERTSAAYRQVTGAYLPGDPRA